MSADDGFRPLADPRYFDDDPDRSHAGADGAGHADDDVDDDVDSDDRSGRHSWCGSSRHGPPAPEPSTPSPPGFLRVAGGLLLIAIGAEFLIERILGVDFDITTLVIGLLLLAWWARSGQFWAYVAGMITAGIGAGAVLGSIVPDPVGGLLAGLGSAGGFALLAIRPPHLKWAWWPAAIIAFFSVAGFGIAVATALFTGPSASLFLPISLVVAGGVLLSRDALSPSTRKALLAGCAVVFVLAASAQAAPFAGWFSEEVVPLDLDGKALVVNAGNNDVTLRTGAESSVRAPSARHVEATPLSSDALRVVLRRDATVTVPPGTAVTVKTEGGGDVDVDDYQWGELSRLSIATEGGDIDVTTLGKPAVDIKSVSGDVEIDGREYGEGFDLPGSDNPDLVLITESGDIAVTRLAS